jgi:anthranilate synthase component I
LDSAVPTVRSFSADFEPLRLIAQFPEAYPGLLESSAPIGTLTCRASTSNAPASGGRFDILPMSSGECLRLDGHRRLSGPHSAGADGFLSALESWWQSLRHMSSAAPLPFTGGWLLYLGYELSAEIEPRLRLPPSADSVMALAIRAPAAWIRDRASGCAWLIAEPGSEALLEQFEDHVRRIAALPAASSAARPSTGVRGGGFEIHEENPAQFLNAVSRSLEYIAAGDVYQTNLSRQWQVRSETPLDPVSIYERLRSTNPSPFAGMMRYGSFSLMSSSPERLLSIRGGIVSTRPIAGTRPRGTSPETDAALIESLLSNEKERAEHVMLIDLERNDLGRVCVGGTVRVDEYMSVETYAHVHHIVSNVSGRLGEAVSPVQVIRALFPGGTITGCPKVRCMEIIAELEGTGRGAYTGSIGYLNRDGSCDLNILIRTLTAEAGARGASALTFRAGAGIVADSSPAQELAETRAKAKGMLRALETVS